MFARQPKSTKTILGVPISHTCSVCFAYTLLQSFRLFENALCHQCVDVSWSLITPSRPDRNVWFDGMIDIFILFSKSSSWWAILFWSFYVQIPYFLYNFVGFFGLFDEFSGSCKGKRWTFAVQFREALKKSFIFEFYCDFVAKMRWHFANTRVMSSYFYWTFAHRH